MKAGGPQEISVLKVGGAHLEDMDYIDALCGLLKARLEAGQSPVLVHGGGAEIERYHEALGLAYEKQLGLHVTSDESMDVVTMVLCGLVNKRVVSRFVRNGLPALGLSGVDLGLLRAEFLNKDALGRVGGPPRVHHAILRGLQTSHFIPVLSPVCNGPDGLPINVNADTAALSIATAMPAASLEFITDVAGLWIDEKTIARRLSARDVKSLLSRSVATGGMIPKLQATMAAVEGGIRRVRIGDLDSIRDNTATEISGDSVYDQRRDEPPQAAGGTSTFRRYIEADASAGPGEVSGPGAK